MTDEREQRKGSVGLGLGLTVMFHVIAQAPVFFLLFDVRRERSRVSGVGAQDQPHSNCTLTIAQANSR